VHSSLCNHAGVVDLIGGGGRVGGPVGGNLDYPVFVVVFHVYRGVSPSYLVNYFLTDLSFPLRADWE
jgi:hypothetical protein